VFRRAEGYRSSENRSFQGRRKAVLLLFGAFCSVSFEICGAIAQDEEADEIVRQGRTIVRPQLSDQLEHSPANGRETDWRDLNSGLSGQITVYSIATRNGQPCRSFKYTVQGARVIVTVSGLRCRDMSGFWDVAGVPDIVGSHDLTDASIKHIQVNLGFLAYYTGPSDGLPSPELANAVAAFEQDEGVAPDTVKDRLFDLTEDAVRRAGRPGHCDPPAALSNQGTIVCGRTP
jgi:surface antigen